MSYTYVTLCTIGIFSLIMFPLYYNAVVNIVVSAITIPVNEIDTTSTISTDDIATDRFHIVELRPKI